MKLRKVYEIELNHSTKDFQTVIKHLIKDKELAKALFFKLKQAGIKDDGYFDITLTIKPAETFETLDHYMQTKKQEEPQSVTDDPAVDYDMFL